MTAFELAKQYYPTLWPLARLDALLAVGKLTGAEYAALTEKEE